MSNEGRSNDIQFNHSSITTCAKMKNDYKQCITATHEKNAPS